MIDDTAESVSTRRRLSEARQFARFAWSTLIAPWPPFAIFLAIGGVVAAMTPILLVRATTGLIDALSTDLQAQPVAADQGRAIGCHAVIVDTPSFQVPGFYRRLGYAQFGETRNYEGAHSRLYFEKAI